jgi:hypothetical protein
MTASLSSDWTGTLDTNEVPRNIGINKEDCMVKLEIGGT